MPLPNLLFLFTDQQRADTMAAYGNDRIQMPHLNRLSSQSTVFERAYVSQPVCTPSRATLLTGLYPHTCGCTANNIPLRPDTPCLPEMLERGKWTCAYFGKWHLGDEIFPQHGFDEWISIEDMYIRYYGPGRDRNARSSYHHFLVRNGFRPENGDAFRRMETVHYPEEFSKPAFLAQEAERFIRQNARRPFVLFVNFLEPHSPYFSPRDDQYDPASVILPPNFRDIPTREQPLKARLLQRVYARFGSNLPLRTEADWRKLIAHYWGLCSLVDTHVGRILKALEECGLTNNTIIVYTSDHGDMMGSHGLVAKTVMFEEAVRVPLLVRLPGQTAQRRIAAPVSQVDLVPTLLDLLGQPVPSHLEGASLRLLLEGKQVFQNRDVFIEWQGPDSSKLAAKLFEDAESAAELKAEGITLEQAVSEFAAPVRTVITQEGCKLNWGRCSVQELYDLNSDPYERRNLFSNSEAKKRISELTDKVWHWQERTRDAVALPPLQA